MHDEPAIVVKLINDCQEKLIVIILAIKIEHVEQ